MNDVKRYSFRQKAGALLLDLPRYFYALLAPAVLGGGWTAYRNRHDRIVRNPSGPGIRCDWSYSRDLHLCKVFPCTGERLMRRALRQWPVLEADSPRLSGDHPEVSFIIGHRGLERLPLLLKTLRSIAAQVDVSFECVVIEQDHVPRVREHLPDWVRYEFQQTPAEDFPYARSWALNAVTHHARAPLLVFHDNDMLVPARYAAELIRQFLDGYEVINLKRFIFYLGSQSAWPDAVTSMDAIVENLEAGGSVAVARSAFDAIGGYDESFVGWGGEDVEFWERCRTRKVWEYAYLPIVHLWHAPQPGKRAVRGLGAETADLTEQRLKIPPAQRIDELVKRERGGLVWRRGA
jgi:hypothetical protein